MAPHACPEHTINGSEHQDPRDCGGVGEYCCHRRVPGHNSARSRCVLKPWPASTGWAGSGVFRGCRRIRRQFSVPIDPVLTEITNDAIHLLNPTLPIAWEMLGIPFGPG